MSEKATIDFETRSDLDVKKVGAYRYAEAQTSVLCLVYKLPGGTPKLWRFGDAPPLELFEHAILGGLIEAHNAQFEYVIWNRVLGWPKLDLRQLRCSAAKAAIYALPRSLEGFAKATGAKFQKDMEGKTNMQYCAKGANTLTPERLERLYSYCTTDVLAEESASESLPDLTPYEQTLWRHTEVINERGVYCDVVLCKRAIKFAARFEQELTQELEMITMGEVKTVGQQKKIVEFVNLNGANIQDIKARSVEKALKVVTGKAKRVLEIRQALSKSSVKKYESMLRMVCSDGRIRGTLLHNGASTGRDTGKGIQPQNFPRGTGLDAERVIAALGLFEYEDFAGLYPNVLEALQNALRGMLCAAPGKKFVAADFASIESRVLFWLARHELGLKMFFNHEPAYEDMASVIYGVQLEHVTKLMRQVGKQAFLGCGYGMGAAKFKITCEIFKIEVSDELAKRAVQAYRKRHHPIPKLWKDVEAAAIAAVEFPLKTFSAGRCAFFMKGRFLSVRLPSGRCLYYCDPVVRATNNKWGGESKRLGYYASVKGQWRFEETYGGKMVENITQAVAVDLMREAAIRQEVKGFPIVMRVHDELIAEIDSTQDRLKEFEELMKELPKWAEGLPIEVEGYQGGRYKK